MRIREPVVAGQFYPLALADCQAEMASMLERSQNTKTLAEGRTITGGLVPHAGWVYSGEVTAKVFSAVRAQSSPSVIVLFGGVHRSRGRKAMMFGDGYWETPVGRVKVDTRLCERILAHTSLIVDDPFAHEGEHSIEVQLPFVARLFPNATIVPIMVPPGPNAVEVGKAVGRTLTTYGYDAVTIGTTDLTHYGPQYGFTPQGTGEQAARWAKEENDSRFIALVCAFKGNELVAEAVEHKNACSSGAAAAALATAAKLGASRGTVLAHTTSREVLAERGVVDVEDSVGYAGIVFS